MGLQFGGHAPQVAAAPPVNGGNCAMQRYDTPQKGFAWRKTPTATNLKYAASPPRPGHSTAWREKVRPARPLRRLFREKTRPARIKTPNLGQFERTGRTFSRFHDRTATQGELFRACRRRPSSALPISDQAPQVWRAWEGLTAVSVGGVGAWLGGPEGLAAVPVGGRGLRRPEHQRGRKQPGSTQQGARSAAAPRAPTHSRVSAHRLSWMLRPGTASISSRV